MGHLGSSRPSSNPQEFIEQMQQRLADAQSALAAEYFAGVATLSAEGDLAGALALSETTSSTSRALEVASQELAAALASRGIGRGAIYDFGRYAQMHSRTDRFLAADRQMLATFGAQASEYLTTNFGEHF